MARIMIRSSYGMLLIDPPQKCYVMLWDVGLGLVFVVKWLGDWSLFVAFLAFHIWTSLYLICIIMLSYMIVSYYIITWCFNYRSPLCIGLSLFSCNVGAFIPGCCTGKYLLWFLLTEALSSIPGYFCEFSKCYFCLNLFLSLPTLYINVAASLQHALGECLVFLFHFCPSFSLRFGQLCRAVVSCKYQSCLCVYYYFPS